MIFADVIAEALTPDPLERAQQSRRMKVSGDIIRKRYEEVHGALRAQVRSVPTEGQTGGCSRQVAS